MQKPEHHSKIFEFNDDSDENIEFVLPTEYQIQQPSADSSNEIHKKVSFDISKNKCHLVERQGNSLTGIFFDEGIEDSSDKREFSIDLGRSELHNSKIEHSTEDTYNSTQRTLTENTIKECLEKFTEETEDKSNSILIEEKQSFFKYDEPDNEKSEDKSKFKADNSNTEQYGCKQDFSLDEEDQDNSNIKDSNNTSNQFKESELKRIITSNPIPFIEAETSTDIKLSKVLSDFVSKIQVKPVENKSQSIEFQINSSSTIETMKSGNDEKIQVIKIGSIKNNPFVIKDKQITK